jgi:hypothetical protein
MHGRAPRGFLEERAPLASTYAQYREYKRAIRVDAACRIQALCRGARARRRNRPQRHQQQQSGRKTSCSPSCTGRRIPDITLLSLAELQQRKRELNKQLKQCDLDFYDMHGRMPETEKRDKVPIRQLYESS